MSGQSSRIEIRFFWLEELVDAWEAVIRHLVTKKIFDNTARCKVQNGKGRVGRMALDTPHATATFNILT